MKLQIQTVKKRWVRLLLVMGALAVYVLVTFGIVHKYRALKNQAVGSFETRGGALYKNGEKFLLKGVGWDPTRPGELPWNRRRSIELIENDFAQIRKAGFNAIRTWELLSRDELAAAERHGLSVLMGVWVDRAGPFREASFRQEQIDKVRRAVKEAKSSKAVLGYLVMNEPAMDHVLKEGLEVTRDFLRDIAAAVRLEDPEALVSFSNWPGVEFLDEPSLPFVAANLHPFRPSALLDAIGYEGMVRIWKEKIAGSRPLLVSEFGVSVSPSAPLPDGPGGRTEEEQKEQLPRMADEILRAGAAGGAAFMWIDGWWKNNDFEGDEQEHDPTDGEEWFGLIAFEGTAKRFTPRARPALEAMRSFNRVVLTLPANGVVQEREVEVEAHTEEADDIRLEVNINGAPAVVVPTVREGSWIRGRIGLSAEARGPQQLHFTARGSNRSIAAQWERIVIPEDEAPRVDLSVTGKQTWRHAAVRVADKSGRALAGVPVQFAVTEAHRRINRNATVMTDSSGHATFDFQLAPAPSASLIVAAVRENNGPLLAYDTQIIISGDR